MNLLIPSVGNKRYLTQRVRNLVHAHGGRLFASDLNSDATAVPHADGLITLPSFGNDNYWSAVSAALQEFHITAVLPVRDAELLGWAERQATGLLECSLLLSSPDALATCHDKFALYRKATAIGIDCPTWQPWVGDRSAIATMAPPWVIKPRYGSGSRGVSVVHAAGELPDVAGEMLVQRHIGGSEYSIDCYANHDGVLRALCVRRRDRVVAGECVEGTVCDMPHLVDVCRTLVGELSFRGVINVQVIDGVEGPQLIDVNPRIPGGIAITESAGYPFIEWTIQCLAESQAF